MNVSCTKEKQSWKPCRNKYARLVFVSAQNLKMIKKRVDFSAAWILLEVFPGHEKCSFWQICRKKFPKLEFFSPKFGNDRKLLKFFEKNFYHPIFPQDTENSLLTHLAISFFLRIKPSAQRPKEVLICTFLSKIVFTQSVCWTREMQTWQLCWIEFAKLWYFFCSKPQIWTKMYAFHQNNFSPKCLLDRRKAALTRMPE